MSVYDKVFNSDVIYNTIFMNVKAVTKYPSLDDLKNSNEVEYDNWVRYSSSKYEGIDPNLTYGKHACYEPEFSKIVGITYGDVTFEDNELKRNIKKLVNDDEFELISEFFNILDGYFTDGYNSSPKITHDLCGHNLMGYDIPFLMKRYLMLVNNKQEISIPPLIKLAISSKPWESNVIDTMDVNKFGSYKNVSMRVLADSFGLKKNVKLLDNDELSLSYWKDRNFITEILTQSLNITNLTIQYLNVIRHI